ncbi:MAG: flavin reductase family protein [Desulfobulbus sp.]|jgi:flavin reductase (DIM6/NTAB) family NADH-FMN oxidoreductase RutF|uniref:flavin reductase family protein n=1 Tax=Desulfobulbus sp. TaxID=895 RepID=UPI002843B956|nr:flavin reductase family protein [Desulfobulbus sp.]MDR2549324.1 flavin reductase family protein [Desulfobulbus sp.]
MNKVDWKPGTTLYPLPAVMVSLGETPEEYNIITIAWTGILCSDPPLCYISVRPERHSHAILTRTREFVINLTTRKLARATDWCGVRSGRQYRKFEEMRLTPGSAAKVKAPIVVEAPINIECRVFDIRPLGTHDMFLAEVVNVKADQQYIDPRTGAFDLAGAEPIAFAHGKYFTLGQVIGKFGFSVEKKRTRNNQGQGTFATGKKKNG